MTDEPLTFRSSISASAPPLRSAAALALLRVAHALCAGLVAASPPAAGLGTATWLALACWPYVLSYQVAAVAVSAGRTGAAVQSTLCLLFTMPAIAAYRGELFGAAPTAGFDAAVSAILAGVLLVASGHGAAAQRCVDDAGTLAPHQRRRLALHAVCGTIAVASLGMRTELCQGGTAIRAAPQFVAALITAALPYAASAIFTLHTVVTGRWRQRCVTTLLGGGTAVSVAYYGDLIGWPLQFWRDWLVLLVLSAAFILTADWAQDEDRGYG